MAFEELKQRHPVGRPGLLRVPPGRRFRSHDRAAELTWKGESGTAIWDEFSVAFGPIVSLLRVLEPDRAAARRSDLIAFFEEGATGDGILLDRPYILVKGTRYARDGGGA